MIRIKLLATLLLCSALGLKAFDLLRKTGPRYPEKEFESYIEKRKAEDVYITLPPNYKPIDVRGKSDIKYSIGDGSFDAGTTWWFYKKDIYAIIEEDSCNAAICFPVCHLDFVQELKEEVRERYGIPNIKIAGDDTLRLVLRCGKSIEADLRMINNDKHLDIRPMITTITEEDMSCYANADTAVIYEWEMKSKPFMGTYDYGIGIYLMKKNHPAQLIRLMLTREAIENKEKYIRDVLDNIHFGDNPNEILVKAEEKYEKIPDFQFPTKYRANIGYLEPYNDDVIEELVRIKEWCVAHGMKELPKIDDEILDYLNNKLQKKKQIRAKADSILSADIPNDQKILGREMLDTEPHFPGEDNLYYNTAYSDWFDSNIRYPKAAAKKGIKNGFVIVGFVVSADGSINNVSIAYSGKNEDESFKQEAIRMVKAMPRWIPGTYKGNAVNSYMELSFMFKYDPKTKKQAKRERNPLYPTQDPIFDTTTIQTIPTFDPGEE